MNLLQLVQRAVSEAGMATGSWSTVVGAGGNLGRMTYWVKDAWRDIQLMPRNWMWMRAQVVGDIVVGTQSYTLDSLLGSTGQRFWRWAPESGAYRVRAFAASEPSTEWALRQLPYDEFEARFLIGVPATADAQFWAEAPNGALLVGPGLVRNLRLRANYVIAPQELALDSDVPEMPSRYHMAIVWRALSSYAGFDAAPEVYARAVDQYAALESALIQEQGEPIRFIAASL